MPVRFAAAPDKIGSTPAKRTTKQKGAIFMRNALLLAALLFGATAVAADKTATHSSGRPLPEMPKIDHVVAFDTPEADRILETLQVFPADNPWNVDVSKWPVHPNSKNLVASNGADKIFRVDVDMSFIIVPPNQRKVDVQITSYPQESDRGPYPVPAETPIENWPATYKRNPKTKDWTLGEVQRDTQKEGGDWHALVVDPTNRLLYEFYQMRKTNNGWTCAQASIFDLKTNRLRPDGWTSADAAGLPIFPAVVRYDELKRGMVEHAMRLTFVKLARYVAPATHFASCAPIQFAAHGRRFGLKADYDISKFSAESQAILKGFKK